MIIIAVNVVITINSRHLKDTLKHVKVCQCFDFTKGNIVAIAHHYTHYRVFASHCVNMRSFSGASLSSI